MKIIQIHSVTIGESVVLYALDDDGTVWQRTVNVSGFTKWLPAIDFQQLKETLAKVGV